MSASRSFAPWLLATCLLITTAQLHAQTPMNTAAQAPDLFDFWIGDWSVTWKGADGSPGSGRNRIARVLDGTVIEETFEETPDGKSPPLKGHSLSVLQKATGKWRQAWADNRGGFFALTAQVDGDKRMFVTDSVRKDGKDTAQRMVFHEIRKDSFTWDWESTSDGGATWRLQWRIEYKRRPA